MTATDTSKMILDIEESDLSDYLSAEGKIRCAFSTSKVQKVGTGVTTRKHITKLFWFVEEVGNHEFLVRQVNAHHVPKGKGKIVALEELMALYNPEMEYFEEQVIPAMEQLEDFLDEGELHRQEQNYYSAEGCFNNALAIDESNVRALFNLGMVYLELFDQQKARDLMRDLLNVRGTFDGKNQHLFNEFGISLRKAGLVDEAVEYYTRALEFVQQDENLYYNLARANYERGDWSGCVDAMTKAFSINPDFSICHELLAVVVSLADDPALCQRQGKPPIPGSVKARVLQLVELPSPGAAERPWTPDSPTEAGDTSPELGHVRGGLGKDLP